MITSLKNATINDIAVKELIFYDDSDVEGLVQFCHRNSISYLPSKDRKKVYRLIKNVFAEIELHHHMCLSPEDLLFEETTLEKFRKVNEHEIKFVTENEKIVGVVHIVDYNNEFVAVELYRAFFKFENNLRTLLIREKLTNEDFLSWLGHQRDIEVNDNDIDSDYWTNKFKSYFPLDEKHKSLKERERKSVFPFQTFYFSDILSFAIDQNILDENIFSPKSLTKLRNYIAHNRHFTSISESDEGQLIYDFSHLLKFIENINFFFISYEELLNQLKAPEKTAV
ncbi:hypothetical protein Q73A0000_05120 [Kaistella flava (ex Peng et al. 2021)]|uniref:Uncharacterized protein n=1 Tax=Kaistella flava (ex Peng et al. 2021) TaxID=2038776 RepID=A0A7M2Y6K7_9FLAO|nr:hypothetical protein [Kaistella flava (ex Peng et al. 2021)]QOW09791.1 hypothetical protein Q73A0000_05120 [Kaistella flava (ex Peng et al. 2021)]